jgi:hypothetical protein
VIWSFSIREFPVHMPCNQPSFWCLIWACEYTIIHNTHKKVLLDVSSNRRRLCKQPTPIWKPRNSPWRMAQLASCYRP